ncbi:MAG: hypothetical protein LN414_08300, partial [Candidatus Thermoplasmatota archaeon]|nr:hypothetical protein [Candidatus Thermoplasmatota archaeon]
STVIVRVFDNYNDSKGQKVRWNFFNYSTPPIAVGDRVIVGVRPYTETNPPLFWWANISGIHTIEFKVFLNDQSEKGNDISSIIIDVAEKPEDTRPPIDVAYLSIIIAVAICAVIVAGYVYALRHKPEVDADLYSSIYGADFEDDVMGRDLPVDADAEAPPMTPEEQALYGDDYDTEGEVAESEVAEGEYEDGEYVEGE